MPAATSSTCPVFHLASRRLVAFLKPSQVHAEATYNVSGTFSAAAGRRAQFQERC
jgi:hypothetical protein